MRLPSASWPSTSAAASRRRRTAAGGRAAGRVRPPGSPGTAASGRGAYDFASVQSSPTPTSTTSGGSSSYAPHISSRTSSRTAATSVAGTSSRSSSCTWRTSRAARPSAREPPVDRDHRDLDHVRRGALHDGVDGEPLAERARLTVPRPELRDRPAPAEQGPHLPVALGLLASCAR